MKFNAIDWWPSPAKINLFLHVCGRFDNGYHELQTLFQLLDYGDQIGFEPNQDKTKQTVTLATEIENVALVDNLIYRAARLLLPHKAKNTPAVKIHLRKLIPMGGGLGGGSSNAATVMLGLNRIWQCALTNTQLQEMGLSLGADVPVFINGYTAFAQGVGEMLIKADLPEYYYLVATPNVHVSTASVFAHPTLPRNTKKIDFADYDFNKTHNDCEKLVCNQHPEVANLLHRLLHYAPSRMTGTGASVFAQFSSQKDAENCKNALPSDVLSFICKGVNKSAVLAKIMN